jgi:hypothetical protein
MKLHSIICLVALIASVADAFTASTHARPRRALISSRKPTAIRADAASEDGTAKKKVAKKAKKAVKAKAPVEAKAPVKAKKDEGEVETFRKPEFVASIAEKTGMSKVDSEAALAAVLDTISEVSFLCVLVLCIILSQMTGLIFFKLNLHRMLLKESVFQCWDLVPSSSPIVQLVKVETPRLERRSRSKLPKLLPFLQERLSRKSAISNQTL